MQSCADSSEDGELLANLGAAVEALIAGPAAITGRLIAAEEHLRKIGSEQLPDRAAGYLNARIGAALVASGAEDASVAESIAAMSDREAAEVATDVLRLYELVAGVRIASSDGFELGPRRWRG